MGWQHVRKTVAIILIRKHLWRVRGTSLLNGSRFGEDQNKFHFHSLGNPRTKSIGTVAGRNILHCGPNSVCFRERKGKISHTATHYLDLLGPDNKAMILTSLSILSAASAFQFLAAITTKMNHSLIQSRPCQVIINGTKRVFYCEFGFC